MVHKTETGGPILPSIQPDAGLLIRIRQGTKFLPQRGSVVFPRLRERPIPGYYRLPPFVP